MLHQYDGNPSLGIPGFRPFSKNYNALLSRIRISQTSSKADCARRISRGNFNSVVFTQYYTVVLTNKYTTDMMCLGIPNYMFLRLCSLFIADSEM